MFFKKNHRKEIIVLNVVALIDITSILIIFLIMGTIFGESTVTPPEGLKMPLSTNKDSVNNAPQITIHKEKVQVWLGDRTIGISDFRDLDVEPQSIVRLKSEVSKYINSLPPDLRKSGILLNVVADRSTKYQDVFDVVAVFRTAGMESILFIAQGD